MKKHIFRWCGPQFNILVGCHWLCPELLAVCWPFVWAYRNFIRVLVSSLSEAFPKYLFIWCRSSLCVFGRRSSSLICRASATILMLQLRRRPQRGKPLPRPVGPQDPQGSRSVCIYESSEWLIDDDAQIMKVHIVIISFPCWMVWPLHSIASQPELSSHLKPHLSGLTVSRTTVLRSFFCFQVNLLIRTHCVYVCLFCISPRAILLSWNQSPYMNPHPCSDTAPPMGLLEGGWSVRWDQIQTPNKYFPLLFGPMGHIQKSYKGGVGVLLNSSRSKFSFLSSLNRCGLSHN